MSTSPLDDQALRAIVAGTAAEQVFDCTEEELEDLMAYAPGHSPVFSTVTRPVPVVMTLDMQAMK